ncbi:U5 small nuclear ribonucleoprotein TSSC4 [Scomber scombrus]|uniref:U5 small nuclear ribonucleoprotein TSSC4 n=1 Tax=Scomber scombrus TaxID=13677 RepID=UPI002DD99A61|nr:U5 small nuclear ribonucleoprotein TSSC4 [Scomber scombrus]
MVLDLARLLNRVTMCDQEHASELSKILKANVDDVDDLSASDESDPEEQPCSASFDPELDIDDDDVEVRAAVPVAGQKVRSPFSLRGGSSGFSNRSHSIFECLDSVAKLASSTLGQDNVIDGVFARPLPPAPSRKTSQPPPSGSTPAKKRGVPDYMVHPDRWTHYSLEDVAETSDRGNSRAALQYLASLQPKKEEPEPDSQGDASCSTKQKIIFSKPSLLAKKPADEPSAGRGQDKKMRLSHLVEEVDECTVGKEKKKGVGRRIDERKEDSVKKTEDTGKEEVKQTTAVISQPEAEEKEKKQKERGVVEEEEDVEEKKEQANPSFASFRKRHQKNYRRSSQQED